MQKRYISYLVIVFLLLILPSKFSATIRNRSVLLVKPFTQFFIKENTAVTNYTRAIGQISDLRSNNSALQQEVISLQQQLSASDGLKRENAALRLELGVTGVTKPLPKVLAHRILLGSDALDRTFIIDVGSNQGIKVGQPVVVQGALIGQIITVRNNSSVVRSIISSLSRIQVWLADNQQEGLLVGDGNTVSLTNIIQGVSAPTNDIVETSGLGNSLPQGIYVGQINSTLSKPSDLSQSFSISLSQDSRSPESMFVLLTGAN